MKRDTWLDDDSAVAVPWPRLIPHVEARPTPAPITGAGLVRRLAGTVRLAVTAWRVRAQTRAIRGLDAATLRDLAIAPCEAGSVAAELSGMAPATRRRVTRNGAAGRATPVTLLADLGVGISPAEADTLRTQLAAVPGVRSVQPSARLPRLVLIEYDPAVTGSATLIEFMWHRNRAARLIGL
jgi:hypothetical protein